MPILFRLLFEDAGTNSYSLILYRVEFNGESINIINRKSGRSDAKWLMSDIAGWSIE
jgi:hypothetical protein